ncbi:alkaline serine exoprotease A-like [Glandiceps talaboti]
MLASIVGGTVSGVAKNVLIRTVRVAPNSAAGAVPDDILAGMDAIMADYANEDRKGVVVAPISIEITPENNIPLILIDQKARDMRNAGLVIAASNGDSPGGTDQCQNYSPGRLQIEPGIIIAGGARIEYAANPVADYRSPNANYGSCPHCYAPAHDIFGAVPGDMFTTGDPNSGFAAGIVGGIAALLRSDCKDLTPAQVKDKLVDGWTNNMDMAYDLDGITALGPVCGVPPVDATPEPTCDPV